ncbi:MAG: endolytic transglycosylase MltG [Ruminococcaceae bacterium]|nr:endolytic transglycosylase MltG [Oscillospiraceae bacterium]
MDENRPDHTPQEPLLHPDTGSIPALDAQWDGESAALTPLEEIGADEQAIASIGLTHPDDLELEKIILETKSDSWLSEPGNTGAAIFTPDDLPTTEEVPAEPTTEDAFKDDEFRAAFGEGDSLNQVFSVEEGPEPPVTGQSPNIGEETPPADPLEKGRPKRKQGYGLLGIPHLAATAIWLLIIVGIGVTIGRMVWLCASDVLALGRDPVTATITIERGDTADDVAEKLKDAGLIRYTALFKFYADFTDAKFIPGVYSVNPPEAEDRTVVYDYMALVDLMSPHQAGQSVVEDLRIPEGYTCAQIFQLLEENNVCTVAELEAYVSNINNTDPEKATELKEYWFLDGVQWGHKYSLEGYLFPNTYDFYENDDPQRVIEKMLDSFNANFNDVMKEKLQTLTEQNGYTIREVIIIASMIEKETANELESFDVSSVIYNRLNNPGEYPYLNIDATIVYALGGKSDLTAEDLKVDSPYNTYTNKGLPPGPIASPSQNSIGAALDPNDTDYHYYAYDPSTAEHHFSKTYKEHLAFLETLEDNA